MEEGERPERPWFLCPILDALCAGEEADPCCGSHSPGQAPVRRRQKEEESCKGPHPGAKRSFGTPPPPFGSPRPSPATRGGTEQPGLTFKGWLGAMVAPGSPRPASSNLHLLLPGRSSAPARLNRSPGGGGGRACSAVERLEADKAKYVKSLQVINRRQEPALRSRSPWLSPGAQRALARQHRQELCQSPVLRRSGASPVLRPESLLTHRQGRDKENAEGSALPPLLCQGPPRDKSPATGLSEGRPAPQSPETPVRTEEEEEEEDGARTPGAGSGGGSGGIVALPGGSVAQPPGKPALALRVSLPLSEQERFFNCCGLDRALVELLGRERFVPAGWDNARALLHGSCESEPGQASGGSDGDVGPGEEEPDARLGSAVSVVERNARIIKWLYECQRAGVAAQEPAV